MAAQGAVLLKNGDAVLPLTADDHVAVFGRCQKDYYRSGTGSGGAVNVLYTTNLVDGLRDNGITVNEALSASYETWISSHPFDNGEGGWACEPWCQLEMPVTQTLVATAAADSNKAVVVIGRTAGEDRDNAATEGSYYLTSTEKEMLHNVYSHFKNVIVVLNVSNIIDMNFMQDSNHIKAVVYAWQGGMEGGNGTADVLTGKEVFQGKLTDTIAKKITDYPADKNHGGKEKNVYQEDIYVGYRYFETFARDTVLYPFGYGLSYTEFSISDSGISRYKNAYVLEAGTYRFHAGANVRNRGRTDKRHSQLAAGKYTSARTVVCKAVLNGEELVTFQTNGTNGRWNLQKLLRVRLEEGCNQITLQLPKPGMEIDFTAFQKC